MLTYEMVMLDCRYVINMFVLRMYAQYVIQCRQTDTDRVCTEIIKIFSSLNRPNADVMCRFAELIL